MIDLKEIQHFEHFEDLCESLLKAKGLDVRRLGRGPGQRGKDLIAKESYVGSLSSQVKTWLVEVKHTSSNNRAITERDVFNIQDRVLSQQATGYFLFTNARLAVNLEQTLHDLKESKVIDVGIWTESCIVEEVLKCLPVFRRYFPESFKKLVLENRTICLAQSVAWKSPLTYILNTLQLIKGFLSEDGCETLAENRIDNLIGYTRTIVDEIDVFINDVSGITKV